MDNLIFQATSRYASIYRIVQHGILDKCPVLVEFDGSRESLQAILQFVKQHEKLEKKSDTPTACRVLQHYIDHFTNYNFSAIACIVLSNIIGIIHVNHLHTPHVINPSTVAELARPYEWDPDYRGMCIYINCDALNIHLFHESKALAYNDLVNYEARRAAVLFTLAVASSVTMVWIYKRYINIY